jgi:hypothetical protein
VRSTGGRILGVIGGVPVLLNKEEPMLPVEGIIRVVVP